jgi:hypothetical protein
MHVACSAVDLKEKWTTTILGTDLLEFPFSTAYFWLFSNRIYFWPSINSKLYQQPIELFGTSQGNSEICMPFRSVYEEQLFI